MSKRIPGVTIGVKPRTGFLTPDPVGVVSAQPVTKKPKVMVTVPDPTDKEWLTQYQVLKAQHPGWTLNQFEEAIGRKQRTIEKQMSFSEFGQSVETQLKVITETLAQGQAMSAVDQASVFQNVANLFTFHYERVKEPAILTRLAQALARLNLSSDPEQVVGSTIVNLADFITNFGKIFAFILSRSPEVNNGIYVYDYTDGDETRGRELDFDTLSREMHDADVLLDLSKLALVDKMAYIASGKYVDAAAGFAPAAAAPLPAAPPPAGLPPAGPVFGPVPPPPIQSPGDKLSKPYRPPHAPRLGPSAPPFSTTTPSSSSSSSPVGPGALTPTVGPGLTPTSITAPPPVAKPGPTTRSRGKSSRGRRGSTSSTVPIIRVNRP